MACICWAHLNGDTAPITFDFDFDLFFIFWTKAIAIIETLAFHETTLPIAQQARPQFR